MVALMVYGCGGGLDLGTSAHTHTHTQIQLVWTMCASSRVSMIVCVHASGERETKGERCIMGRSWVVFTHSFVLSLSLSFLLSQFPSPWTWTRIEQVWSNSTHTNTNIASKSFCALIYPFFMWFGFPSFVAPGEKKQEQIVFVFLCSLLLMTPLTWSLSQRIVPHLNISPLSFSWNKTTSILIFVTKNNVVADNNNNNNSQIPKQPNELVVSVLPYSNLYFHYQQKQSMFKYSSLKVEPVMKWCFSLKTNMEFNQNDSITPIWSYLIHIYLNRIH